MLLAPTLDDAAGRCLLAEIDTLWLDRGYDSGVTRQRLAERQIDDAIIAKRRKRNTGEGTTNVPMGLRWPVERTNSWLSNFGQLRRNTDRRTLHRLAQFALAVAVLLTAKLIDWRNRWNPTSDLPLASNPTGSCWRAVEVPPRGFGSLALPATGTEVAQFVALRAAACVGADYSNLASLDQTRRSLRLFHGAFLAPAIPIGTRTYRWSALPDRCRRPYGDSDPAAGPRRLPRPIPRDPRRHRRRRYPRDGVAAVYRESGSLVGAIGFAWTTPVRFDTKLQSALHAVAELCTATIERAERHNADHQFIVDLSASLLGASPSSPGSRLPPAIFPRARRLRWEVTGTRAFAR